MAELRAMEQRRQDRPSGIQLVLRANGEKREMEEQGEDEKKHAAQKREEERKAAEANIAKEMEELKSVSFEHLAYLKRRRKLENERDEEEKKLRSQQIQEEEARVFNERSEGYGQMVRTLRGMMNADEQGFVAKKTGAKEEEMERAEKVMQYIDEVKAAHRQEQTESMDDSDDDDFESVASDEEGGTNEFYDKVEMEELVAEAQQRQEDERVGVEYKGPYNVSMNRFMLEKSEKGRAGKMLNKLRSHWIDCYLFVYPSDNCLLVYQSVKGKKEGVQWKFGVGERFPTLSHVQYKKNRSNTLLLEGLVYHDNISSRAKNLMLSFETRHDRYAFEENVRSWTIEKEEEIDDDDSAEDMGEDIAVFCEQCEQAYDSAELNKRCQAGDEIVYICPKGHECASQN